MKKISLFLIKLYQKTLSPDHSWVRHILPFGCCKFTPTCSQYTYDAINKYGVIKGSALGFWRILRCNPWSRGGSDPVQ